MPRRVSMERTFPPHVGVAEALDRVVAHRGARPAHILVDDAPEFAGNELGAWAHEVDDGRACYAALGHTPESYSESEFIALVDNAIR